VYQRSIGLSASSSLEPAVRAGAREDPSDAVGPRRPYTPRVSRLVELSHVIRDGLVTYPGLPPPRMSAHLSFEASRERYAPGTQFEIGRIEMVANTGTYVDAPSHRFAGGGDVASWPLEKLLDLPGLVVDLPAGRRALLAADLAPFEVAGRAVLVRTGWSRHFGTPEYGSGHPHLAAGAALALIERGAALLGIDSLNVDDTTDGRRPVHTELLGAGIPIVEHLRGLEDLPREGFRFFALPARVAGIGSFPVRAFAIVG
jgi:kynurenine formamidase